MNDKVFDLSKPVMTLFFQAMDMLDDPNTPKELKQEANAFIGVLRESTGF